MLIDTHTHLYLDKFREDIDDVISKAIEQDVRMMLLPNIDSDSIDDVFDLYKKYPFHIRPMVGLHPCSVNEKYRYELDQLEKHLVKGGVVAIGEIGIDLYWDKSFEKQQIEAFEIQIDWALAHELPIVIHSRNAIKKCIEVVRKKQNGRLRGVFHCFDQDIISAREITALGFYLGIGGVLTFKNSKLPEVIKHIDLQHIILETDSPYLAPMPYRGKRNESSYVRIVAEKLSEIKEIPIESIEEITTQNAKDLFSL